MGGKSVDDQFIKFLSELLGEMVWGKVKTEHKEDYLDILRTFESKKRTIKSDKNGNTRMPIPYAFVKLCLESHGVKNFNEIIQKSEAHKDNVTISI